MHPKLIAAEAAVPEPARSVLRGVGQVFFQENALTGACFALGIAINSPIMALGAVIGASIGTATARLAKFKDDEIAAGLHGFNATLVGIASLFFFQPGVAAFVLLILGSIASTFITRLFRQSSPFPTYTSPFILVTWVIYFLAPAIGATFVESSGPLPPGNAFIAVANGVGQVMFQANVLTAILFVIGIALSEWRHAAWVVAGSVLGLIIANYHVTPAQRALEMTLDPERLVERFLSENINLGLYGYNATLVAVALYLWRRSFIPALLGVLFSVPLTELLPKTGLPALTAPFVFAAWIVLGLGWLDERLVRPKAEEPAPTPASDRDDDRPDPIESLVIHEPGEPTPA